MTNYIIIAVVLVLIVLAVRKARSGGGCHGGGASGKQFKATKVTDTDEDNYPYAADYRISGMSCEHCVNNVTNALQSIDGTWARVDLDSRKAHVLSKNPIDQSAYEKVVDEAGYTLKSWA